MTDQEKLDKARKEALEDLYKSANDDAERLLPKLKGNGERNNL